MNSTAVRTNATAFPTEASASSGAGPGGRTLSDMLLKTFVIHFVAACTYGHLNSLFKHTHKNSVHVLKGIGFLICPFMPVVELVLNASALIVKRRRVPRSKRYIIGCILGTHVVPLIQNSESGNDQTENGKISYPLISVECELERAQESAYGMTWCGRVIVVFGTLVPASLTLVLLIRRINFRKFTLWDLRNGIAAIGGGTAATMSLAVLILNTKWTIQPSNIRVTEQQQKQTELTTWRIILTSLCLEISLLLLQRALSTPYLDYTRLSYAICSPSIYCVFLDFVDLLPNVGSKHLCFLAMAGLFVSEIVFMYCKGMSPDAVWQWADPLSQKLWVF